MNSIFKSHSIDISTWVEILIISSGVMFVVEIKRTIEKRFFAKR